MAGWKHYEPEQRGTTCVIDREQVRDLPYEIGHVSTGKQKVFHRYYVKITLADGSEIIGEDPHNIRTALFHVDQELGKRHCILIAAGVEKDFSESGLSHNSGYGYLPNIDRAIHMMDLPPPRQRGYDGDEFVSNLIREAVAGMFRAR